MKLKEFLTGCVGNNTSVTISYISKGVYTEKLELICSMNSAPHTRDEWLRSWSELIEHLEVARVDPVMFDDKQHLLITVVGQ